MSAGRGIVLSADLVHVRRRGVELEVVSCGGQKPALVLALATSFVELARAHVGKSRASFLEACAAVEAPLRARKLAAGLQKLVEDRCTFETVTSMDPVMLRHEVFSRASVMRQQVAEGETWDRDATLHAIAIEKGLTAEELEQSLYADLRAAQRLCAFSSLAPEALVEQYDDAQAQAVLLRAVRVEVEVTSTPYGFRLLFRKLKFLRLLYRVESLGNRYRLVLDGPFSLFAAVTKYGLQFALILSVLQGCTTWSLTADVRWGKSRTPMRFRLQGEESVEGGEEEARLPDEVAVLLLSLREIASSWTVEIAHTILDLPGVGVCLPDLVFEHPERGRVYLEVMGYWSREAVWRRVELMQKGLSHRILFAVSERLRVSEAVLEDLPGLLYVYKGSMRAKAVLDRVEKLGEAPSSS